MIEYENIFNDRFIMFKTTSLEGFRTIKEKDRKCNTCSKYNIPEKDMCIPVGIIANPDCPYCSWYKSKHEKKIETKRCSSCREIKSIDEFYTSKSNSDGYQYNCSKCAIDYSKELNKDKKVKLNNVREYRSVK